MSSKQLVLSSSVAVVLGCAQTYLLLVSWAFIASHSPLVHWLINRGFNGAGLSGVVFVTDLLVSTTLCLPAALVLLRLRPRKIWVSLVLAVIPSFIWLNHGLPGHFSQIPLGGLILAWLGELLALPLAVWLVHAIRGASNNSFKPNPLRGSA